MLPIFPLSTVLLPDGQLELKVFESRYRAMLADCLKYKIPFGVVFCEDESSDAGALRGVGCLADIVDCKPYGDGGTLLTIRGAERFLVGRVDEKNVYFQADGGSLEDIDDLLPDDPILVTAATLLGVYRELLALVDPQMLQPDVPLPLKPSDSFRLIEQLLLPEEKRQTALEIGSRRSRFALAIKYLRVEVERLRFILEDENPAARVVN